MRRRKFTDMALAYTAARLVVRLIETPSRRAELACQKWARRSARHMDEILKTLATMKSLDSLGTVGRSLEQPLASPCRERKAAAVSARPPRMRIAGRRPASAAFGRTGPAHHRKDDADA